MEGLSLKQKLIEIRASVGYLQKTLKGNQGAMYVNPSVLLAKIREGMDKHNILLYLSTSAHSVTQYPAPTKNNPKNEGFICNLSLTYTWADAATTDTIECDWFAVGSHLTDPAMAYGGALTYSERYFLLKFFQIPTTKDDPEFLKAEAGIFEPVTKDQLALLDSLIAESDADEGKFLNFMGIKSKNELNQDTFNTAVLKLRMKIKNKQKETAK